MKKVAEKEGIIIQHAENGGEFKIPGTKFRVDGYCEGTNTIYEYYGDYFHGNPDTFQPDDLCHPYNKNVTAGDLFERTKEREKVIRDLGYNLITKWENKRTNK